MTKNLTPEERELLNSYENEEWRSVMTKETLTKYKAAAQSAIKKDKRINIRISSKDLELLQERALVEGIPYQTLMSSILHRYVYGNLIEKTRNTNK